MTNNYLKVLGVGLQQIFFFNSFDFEQALGALQEAEAMKALHDSCIPKAVDFERKQACISVFRACQAIPRSIIVIGETTEDESTLEAS